MSKRVGRIRISHDQIFRADTPIGHYFWQIKFIPVSVLPDHLGKNMLEYYGFSEQFDKVPEGAPTPLYNLLITSTADGDLAQVERVRGT